MKKRRKQLAPEDQELWSRVKSTVIPIHEERLFAPPKAALIEELIAKPASKNPDPVAPFLPAYRPEMQVPVNLGSDLDKPAYRKLSKGRTDIDARIDLHDMTQNVAHHRLANFLEDCVCAGFRHVLVITGKGTSSGGHGVLRRMAPLWLNTEPMKHFVSGFSTAARHHGGEGALYIRLKRPRLQK